MLVNETRRRFELTEITSSCLNGRAFFGLSHVTVVESIEALPDAALCANYEFKLRHRAQRPIRPREAATARTCARFLPYEKTPYRNTQGYFRFLATSDETNEASSATLLAALAESTSGPSGSRFCALPIAMRYRQLRHLARERQLYRVAPSMIQGLGLIALRTFEKDEMVIEYVGEIVGQFVADRREREYDNKGVGCYMFRLDHDAIVDATFAGNEARFVNHSCEVRSSSLSAVPSDHH